jgi:hypothetical protein
MDNKIDVIKMIESINPISAKELPALEIKSKLKEEDLVYIEHEVIPFSILNHIKSDFELFSEEWTEFVNEEEHRRTAKSGKVEYKFFQLENNNFIYKNKLIQNTYFAEDGFKVRVNEIRKELILTDGEIFKHEKTSITSQDGNYQETDQIIGVFNASFTVILNREKLTNVYGKWAHKDVIEIYMNERTKLDYLRFYLSSEK